MSVMGAVGLVRVDMVDGKADPDAKVVDGIMSDGTDAGSHKAGDRNTDVSECGLDGVSMGTYVISVDIDDRSGPMAV